jgi:CheY-like chemotaxis protein
MTTILIADDDADVCLVIEGSLVFSGFDAISVADSTAALARLPAAPVILMTGYYSAGMEGGDSATTILY